MATTDKYDLETYAYSVTDKSGIATANAEKLDDHIHTRLSGTFGEAIDEYEAVYLKPDGKYWLAQADGTAQPCIGLSVDSGIADEAGRVQRVGPITNSGWAWATIGGYVYLDPTTPGALTQTAPGSGVQVIGIADSATTIYLYPLLVIDIGSSGTTHPYDIGGTFNGVPTDGLVMLRYPMPRAVTFPAGLTTSKMIANTAATASTVFSLKKNGTEFGTATFAAAGTSATFAAALETSFAAGDILTIVAPATADATLADLGWAIVGSR